MKSKSVFVFFLVFASIYFCFILFHDHGYLMVEELNTRKESLVSDNKKIQKEIYSLSSKVKRLKEDPGYIEHIMRNEFNMVSSEEFVIYIGD